MKRRIFLLLAPVAVAVMIWSCGGAKPCGLFCPAGGSPNIRQDKVVDVFYCDGRERTYRLGFDGCTSALVADPNKGESCQQCRAARVRQLPFFTPFPLPPINLLAVPSSFRFTLDPGDSAEPVLLNTSYGTPVVYFRDSTGMIIGYGTVTAVAADGTWLDAIPPDLSEAFSGTWSIDISNMATNGQYVLVGTATMEAYGREPPDRDGDGVPDYWDCFPDDPSQSYCGGGDGGGGTDPGGCDPECIMY